MIAKEIMTKDVLTINQDEKVSKATEILLSHKISGLPVVDEENKVVGVISETDLIFRDKEIHIPAYLPLLGGFIMLESIKKFEKHLKKASSNVIKDVMTAPAVIIDQETEVSKIIDIMITKGVNRLPVVDSEKKIVGIIARSDILKSIG